MPSVGMRRTTRVFGARVLRSGRRLWTQVEGKHLRAGNGEKLIGILENGGVRGGAEVPQCKENGWHENDAFSKQQVTKMEVDSNLESRAVELELERHAGEAVNENANVGRRWGAVYRRKRKYMVEGYDSENKALEDRRFGKHFVRKQWKKKARYSPKDSPDLPGSVALSVVIHSSYSSGRSIYCLLNSLLGCLRRSMVNLEQFFAFICSKPICDVFSSHGIHFLKECTPEMRAGVCIISGVRYSVPLFTVNFSAIPCCFMYLHSSLSLRSVRPSYALWMHPMGIDVSGEMPDYTDYGLCDRSESDKSGHSGIASDKDHSRKWVLAQPTIRVPKLAARNSQLKSGRTIQKRRRGLRPRRGKRSSVIGLQKANGAMVSDSLRFRHSGIQLSSMSSHSGLRGLNKTTARNIKELKSALLDSTQDLDATSCSANLLVIESDKGYREEGAVIALEQSVSKQWTLAVKKGGTRRYNLTAEKVMRPCSSNRVTHDIIWTVDNSWKLEFPNRRDWLIFKELYKECVDRNVQPSSVSTIPVPGICEVSGYAESGTFPFIRPESYITVKTDELARALDKRTANYDLDTDDEEWVNEFNSQCCIENNLHQCITVERFELMIDSLEKWVFCNPDGSSDDKAALITCLSSERKETAEAVYGYWCKKRKQKRSPLIRVFQLYQPRRTLMTPKYVLRKKRSFKRQGSQAGRGKQRTFLQGLAAKQDAQQQQQSAILKVKEAKAAANRQEGLAVIKRQKAQQLMENADLATYKAMMALRIAEAARNAESTENAAASSLLS
nr:uncharacterized protein LOC109155733 [Ipomoea batatas]